MRRKGELGKDQLRQLLQSLDTAADSRLLGQVCRGPHLNKPSQMGKAGRS